MNTEFKLICDIREDMPKNMISKNINFSDHPPKDNILEIKSSIEKCGYACSVFGGIPELIEANNIHSRFENCIFLNLTDGLDIDGGRMQAPILLEELNVPYSGASPFQAALIDNKYYTKLAVEKMNILVPDSLLVHNDEDITKDQLSQMPFPLIIKPNKKGSSLGITQESVCFDPDYAYALVQKMKPLFSEILIEQFIPGYEITNFVIGNKEHYYINTPVLEEFHGNMLHQREVMAIEDKAYRTRTFHLCSEILGTQFAEKIGNTSRIIKETLRVHDIIRIDYRITSSGEIYFIEANTVPRICSKNEAGFICEALNQPYHYFMSCLLHTVSSRYNLFNHDLK